jgi:wyosine [tRNA(Phe)-imidazoG37] synthetase (radical SAM superfamily)
VAFPPVIHEPFSSVRFERVLFVELAPGPPDGSPCRYCRALDEGPLPSRTFFSEPAQALRAILAPLERGAAVDAVVFGGRGDPLRHKGIGNVLRNLRRQAHVGTVVLTDGALLRDREARRDAGEAETVMVWLPSIVADAGGEPANGVAALDRRTRFERHVEGIASLKRETPTRVSLEIPVRPGVDDQPGPIEAWRKAADRIAADRILVVPAPGVAEDVAGAAVDRVRAAMPKRAGAFLCDDTLVDVRCFRGDESE